MDTLIVRGRNRFLPDSHVEDSNRELLPVYHGTRTPYETPDVTKSKPNSLFGPGHYTTENPEVAATPGYAGEIGKDGAAPNVHKQYLDIRKPLYLDDELPEADSYMEGSTRPGVEQDPEHPIAKFLDEYQRHAGDHFNREMAVDQIGDIIDNHGPATYGDLWKALKNGHEYVGGSYDQRDANMKLAGARVNETLQKMGYDGLTHIGSGKGRGGAAALGEHRVWIAFKNDQIHSAFAPVKAQDGTGLLHHYNPGDPQLGTFEHYQAAHDAMSNGPQQGPEYIRNANKLVTSDKAYRANRALQPGTREHLDAAWDAYHNGTFANKAEEMAAQLKYAEASGAYEAKQLGLAGPVRR